jgi:hypothetical protein
LAVPFGIAWPRRTKGAVLAETQITAEHGETGVGKGFCHSHEQGGLAVGTGAVGEHQAIAGRLGREMQKAAHRMLGRSAGKWFEARNNIRSFPPLNRV